MTDTNRRLITVFSSLLSFSGSGKQCISGNVEMSDTNRRLIEHFDRHSVTKNS
jgi:hypothetical protein